MGILTRGFLCPCRSPSIGEFLKIWGVRYTKTLFVTHYGQSHIKFATGANFKSKNLAKKD